MLCSSGVFRREHCRWHRCFRRKQERRSRRGWIQRGANIARRWEDFQQYSEADQEPRVFKGSETGFVEENRAFVDCLIHDTSPPIDHIDGLMATLMVLQAFNSLESGRCEPIAALVRDMRTHRKVS